MRCSLRKCSVVSSCQEPGRDHCFKLIRRKGEEILLAAEDGGELERWLAVFHRETLNNHLSQGLCLHNSRWRYAKLVMQGYTVTNCELFQVARCNNVVQATLFLVVNNSVQYCYIVEKPGTMWGHPPTQHCCILLSTASDFWPVVSAVWSTRS